MAEGKRIIFSNETPNDQNSIIPNDVFDFDRYKKNPVLLKAHNWHADSIGKMTDIKLIGKNWTGIPLFHKITEESKIAAEMYEKGWLCSSSVGGQAVWKIDPMTGTYWKDENGLMRAEKFIVYEISLPTLPSNPDAVTIEAMQEAEKSNLATVFAESECNMVHDNIITLMAKFETAAEPEKTEEVAKPEETQINNQNTNKMAEKTKSGNVTAVDAEAEKSTNQPVAEKDNSNHVILKSGLPSWLEKLIGLSATYAHPEGKYGDTPIKEKGTKDIAEKLKPTGLKAAKARKEAEKAEEEAEACKEKAKELKAKYEKAEDGEEKEKFKVEYEKAKKEAEEKAEEAAKYCKEAEEAEEEAEEEAKSKEEAEEKAKEEASKKEAEEEAKSEKEASKNATKILNRTIMKTAAEISDLKLADVPTHKITLNQGVSFTKLMADVAEDRRTGKGGDGARVMNRVLNGSNEGKSLQDYCMVLNALMNDPKYKTIIEKTRFHSNPNDVAYGALRKGLMNASPSQYTKMGIDFNAIAARLNSGKIEGINWKQGIVENRIGLSTSGDFSSLDTIAVEWLPLIIYKLFPSEEWSNDIPIFGVQETTRNYGIIWTNIIADPTIYRGTQPSGEADYTYDDQAVGLSLVPYYIQPMRWTPLHMAQLRYDQQASGWAQALNYLKAQIHDDYLYTLAAGALANGQPKLLTGGPIDNTQAQNFIIGAGSNGVDSFYFNPSFAGNLIKPGFNDVLKLEQFFKQSNFDLNSERVILVIDSVMESYIKQDKQTQSLLTRWINDNGADIQKISHSQIHERSRVAAYDPSGNTVIDTFATSGIVPATTISAGLSMVASQVGIGLGQIDVFFVQDPTNYGYKMSMDIRTGIRALRQNYLGVQMYTYNQGSGQ